MLYAFCYLARIFSLLFYVNGALINVVNFVNSFLSILLQISCVFLCNTFALFMIKSKINLLIDATSSSSIRRYWTVALAHQTVVQENVQQETEHTRRAQNGSSVLVGVTRSSPI